ncbi:MAG: hypothetical protein F6K47_15945 [Symploca sp. SIO2E6]|nr:hypothetical protein [Symploca sp. SIO2E6]
MSFSFWTEVQLLLITHYSLLITSKGNLILPKFAAIPIMKIFSYHIHQYLM